MIEALFTGLFRVADLIIGFGKDKRELRDNALRAISYAINETYIYYRDLDKGKPRNSDTEAQLPRYWAAAVIPLRHIDDELANICEYKSEYWIKPESWDNAKIERFKIGLEEVRKKYRHLLYPGLFPLNRRKANA